LLHSASEEVERIRLAVNSDKPDRWKGDIAKSVDLFNGWFIKFAPTAFRKTRIATTRQVEAALGWTHNLTRLTPQVLRAHPDVLQTLRMTTCPPIARDRLVGLSAAGKGFVGQMEKKNAVPSKMHADTFEKEAHKVISTIEKLVDPDIFEKPYQPKSTWLIFLLEARSTAQRPCSRFPFLVCMPPPSGTVIVLTRRGVFRARSFVIFFRSSEVWRLGTTVFLFLRMSRSESMVCPRGF
jgi:hypothetical protein